MDIITDILNKAQEVQDGLTDIARDIYYAKSLLPKGHPAEANLDDALGRLGVKSPREVGLSNSVLEKRQ